jgi:P4 family phage/plasmid primase-like protien
MRSDHSTTVRKQVNPADAPDDHRMLDAALRYADQGIPVFPCNRKDKAPLTRHGFKDATTDRATIISWWSKWPNAMIGVPTGKRSGIDVLDLDVKPDEFINGLESVPQWQKCSPVIARTPRGGAHLWFKSDGEVRNSTDVIAPGVDTRGEGGYVIVPPSANKKERYWFERGSEHDIDRLPAFPAKLFTKLGPKSDAQAGDEPEANPAIIAAALEAIPNPDLGWDDWKKFGLATWRATAGSEEGFKAWNAFSQKSSKYDANNTRQEWDAIKRSPPERIGAGTIIYHANAADPEWRRSIKGIVLLPAEAPLRCAEEFVKACYLADDGVAGLRYYRGDFYEWAGSHYMECDDDHLRSGLYEFLDKASTVQGRPFNPNKEKVNKILDALQSLVNEDARCEVPFWTGPREGTEIENFIVCRNGLLNIDTRELQPHSPHLFNVNCLPFDYDPNAPTYPKRWMRFLKQLWPGDGDGKRARWTLQEIFGLLLTPDTSFQKIFMLVGPKRSGKGTIARVLTALLGKDNVAGPTLSSLSTNFGLSPLINKRAAIISDARLGAKTDAHTIAERLLSISGEDMLTVDRKYRDPWTGRLFVRFLILTNELPRIADASGALASRFVLLTLATSFFGREDKKLTNKLLTELPGILNWALRGKDRLRERGYFEMPKSSLEAVRQLEDLASPVGAFIRDWCVVDPNEQYSVKGLFRAWGQWCELEGHKAGSQIVFGRNLKAALPRVKARGRGVDRFYEGVALSKEGEERYDHALRASPNRRSSV